MRLSGVAVGDLVLVDHKGRAFLALVDQAVARGELAITPLKGANVNYRRAKAREVKAHYKHRGCDVHRCLLVGAPA